MSLLPNVEKRGLLADSEPSSDLDRALVEAAEEMKFDWPEFLPVERIKAGISEIALGCILFAALLTFVSVHLKSDVSSLRTGRPGLTEERTGELAPKSGRDHCAGK
jgi:hypothetical protein